jgi:hypothetical protein
MEVYEPRRHGWGKNSLDRLLQPSRSMGLKLMVESARAPLGFV